MRLHRLLAAALLLFSSASQASDGLRLALIKTADAETREALTVSGGDWGKTISLNHIAVLLQHPKGAYLFDSGLGSQAAAQESEDMPYLLRGLMRYQHLNPARVQLGDRHLDGVILSHAHWDHASGLADFPETPVWVTAAERQLIDSGKPPTIFPSQYRHQPRWNLYTLAPQPFHGFAESHDLFGDGSAVLVGMAGHTPGSVGLYATLPSGRRLLFVGDTIWRALALQGEGHGKFWLSRWVADNNSEQVDGRIQQLLALQKAEPELTIVPAHDSDVQDKLGFWPAWVD